MIHRDIYVRCDICGMWSEDAERNAITARETAAKQGWQRINRNDLCPTCAAKPENANNANSGRDLERWIRTVAAAIGVTEPAIPEPLTLPAANAAVAEMLRSRDAAVLDRSPAQ